MQSNAHHLLLDLYAEWRRLTELEGAAIGRDEWPCVAQQQQLKRGLQTRIIEATESWQRERQDTSGGMEPFEREFRPIVSDLIQMESRNHELLCERRTRTQTALAALDRSASHLRGIGRAYATPEGSRWQSYS
jgi:hypothetical protein